MTEREKTPDDFRQDVKNFMLSQSKSQSKLAKMADIAPSALSQVLSGTYKGNTSEVMKKIYEIMERENQKNTHQIKEVGFIETTNFDKASFALDVANWDCKIICIIGDAGVGKTESITRYGESNKSAIIIQADNQFNTRMLMEEIAESLDISLKCRETAKLVKEVVKKLKGTNRMLIIDEIDELKDREKALNLLRRIHDKARIPVALVGMTEFLPVISREEKVFSRMNLCRLEAIKKEDTRQFVESVFNKTTDDIIEQFHSLCQGSCRILTDLIRLTQRVMIKNNIDKVTVTAIKKASEALIQVRG